MLCHHFKHHVEPEIQGFRPTATIYCILYWLERKEYLDQISIRNLWSGNKIILFQMDGDNEVNYVFSHGSDLFLTYYLCLV